MQFPNWCKHFTKRNGNFYPSWAKLEVPALEAKNIFLFYCTSCHVIKKKALIVTETKAGLDIKVHSTYLKKANKWGEEDDNTTLGGLPAAQINGADEATAQGLDTETTERADQGVVGEGG